MADHAAVGAADPAATDLLLNLATGAAGGATGAAGGLAFDRADVSRSGLDGRTEGASWWDAGHGGVRLRGVTLRGASLRWANLTGADLTGADLGEASCSNIVLSRARLEQANLREADLIGADLTEVDAGEADFTGALLEDARLTGARLRFAHLEGAVMDGADLSGADLWGARLVRIEAERANFRHARLDEARMNDADLVSADFTGATLRRADLSGAKFRGANLRDAVLEGTKMAGADLTGATLPHVSLSTCELDHVRFAGAWLERTRMRAHQLGGATGEEIAGEFEAAVESYIVLEQNFRSLGSARDASWAFRRGRRMGKRLHGQHARQAFQNRNVIVGLAAGLRWLNDCTAEWLCDYGESVTRVLRAFLLVLGGFAVMYWLTGCLAPRNASMLGHSFPAVDYVLFSLDSMTTVGTSEVALRPNTQLGVLLSSVQTVMGTILLGLFGFVLGVRMRN